MKNLETEAIEQILSIIPNHPAMRIMHISEGGEQFCDALKDFTEQREYEYQLNITNDIFYYKIKELYSDNEWCNIKQMDYKQRKYVNMAKQYDFVFVTASISNGVEEDFAKKIHSHIKNAGNLIMFLPKDDIESKYKWFRYLEESLFVAINSIDIFENYEIVIAKKMHGWGN